MLPYEEGRVCSPEGSLPAQQVVLIDDPGDGPALPDTSAVTYQIGRPVSVGEERLVLLHRCGQISHFSNE